MSQIGRKDAEDAAAREVEVSHDTREAGPVVTGEMVAGLCDGLRGLVALAVPAEAVVLITLNQGQPRTPQSAAITIEHTDNRLAESA